MKLDPWQIRDHPSKSSPRTIPPSKRTIDVPNELRAPSHTEQRGQDPQIFEIKLACPLHSGITTKLIPVLG
ncbi:hypothetical protein QJS04_geneDACA018556 [Acorus gramineus]|uniref:Uncharacterized protein n=1 Tax=Acorus gramineus TaxID=55184 RepID=A0AAV9BVN0_ACOGR|nr:hypothetical protein QJS04_geneDACA018556 [Acorus gramineus]